MIGDWLIEGHAIVSHDDRIAGPDGLTPAALRNDADWTRFQVALDRASVTILGRHGHEANPNRKRRNRLVLSTSASGIERRADAWWWNPTELSVDAALAKAAPNGGIAAVPGGRQVFDMFLEIGFDAFHLARAQGVTVPDGVPIFSAVSADQSAESILAVHGLAPGPVESLDAPTRVSLTVWRPRRA